MSKISIIRDELLINPGLYGAMTDQEVVDELNAVNKTRNRTSLTGSEIWENTAANEYDALPDVKKSQWLALCGIDSINPFGPAAAVAVGLFGPGSQTIAALQIARLESVSRAQILGLPKVHATNVANARAL